MLRVGVDEVENDPLCLARPEPTHAAHLLDIEHPTLCRAGSDADDCRRFIVAFREDPTVAQDQEFARAELVPQLAARLERRMAFSLSIAGRELYVSIGTDTLTGAVLRYPVERS